MTDLRRSLLCCLSVSRAQYELWRDEAEVRLVRSLKLNPGLWQVLLIQFDSGLMGVVLVV
jgi:hypothetical protein